MQEKIVKRLDFLGVPGVGKTTTYNLLRGIRQSHNEFLLFEEAYHKVIFTRLPGYLKVGDLFRRYCQKYPSSRRLFSSTNSWLEIKLDQARSQIEKANYLDSIREMGEKHPAFLQLTLEGIGKQKIIPSKMVSSDYYDAFIKIINRLNQYDVLKKYFFEDSMIIFDSSFSHKIFSVMDFSKEVDPAIISQYFEVMPHPSAVAIFNLPQTEIANRIRNRAREGYANPWHSPIVNTTLLESWVEFACEVALQARLKLLDLGIPVIDLDGSEQPAVLAGQIRDYILHLKLK
jgi:hypothetical protein